MATIYLSGVLSGYDDPFEWMDEVQEKEYAQDHDFINPYELNDATLGDNEVYEKPELVVNPAIDAIENDVDGMLIRWDPDVFLVGSTIEMWHAAQQDRDIPIVLQYDEYKLSPWVLHIIRSRHEDLDTSLRVLLGLLGDKDALTEREPVR